MDTAQKFRHFPEGFLKLLREWRTAAEAEGLLRNRALIAYHEWEKADRKRPQSRPYEYVPSTVVMDGEVISLTEMEVFDAPLMAVVP